MKFQTLMVLKAVVCLVFGLAILLMPELLYSIYGLQLNPSGTYPAREYGAAMMGVLMITWFARNARESDALRAIILGLCVYNAIGFVVTLVAVISGLMNLLGWSVVVLYLFFAVGFGYFLIKNTQQEMQESAV